MQETEPSKKFLAGEETGGRPLADAPYLRDTDAQNFSADVLEASQERPVIVDFWAPWCQPCKQLTPLLEEAVRKYEGAVHFVKVNIDENQMLARQLQVQSIPAVFAFVGGRTVDGFIGARGAREVQDFVSRLAALKEDATPPLDAFFEAAEKARDASDFSKAMEIYAEILRASPDEMRALGGLAECYLESGDLARAKHVLAEAPQDQKSAAALAPAFAMLALAEKLADIPSADALSKNIKDNPQDWDSLFQRALRHHGEGRKYEALQDLLEIIKNAPQEKSAAAKAQLLDLFAIYGAENDATLWGRRALSSLLFR